MIALHIWSAFEHREYFGTTDMQEAFPEVKINTLRCAIYRHPEAFCTLAPGLYQCRKDKPVPKPYGRPPKRGLRALLSGFLR